MRRTTLSYVLALSLIAVLAIATHAIVDAVVQRMEDGAEVVNVSGRQRMLSQRIVGFAEQLSYLPAGDEADRAAVSLTAAVDLMEATHLELVGRLSDDSTSGASGSAAVRRIYFDAPHDLDRRLRAFVRTTRDLLELPPSERAHSAALQEIVEAAEFPLLHTLDVAVAQYQSDSEQRVDKLRIVLAVMLVVMLLALVLEAVLIFRPLIRRLVRSNTDLRGALDEVENRRAQVSLLLDNSGQGFFSFARDLLVDGETSRACRTFFAKDPKGDDAAELLFPASCENADLFRSVMESVFGEDDPFRQEMMVSLLPARIDLGEYALRLEVTRIDGNRAMAVLTDISEEVTLSRTIAEERKQSEMIIAAVVDRHDFFLATEEFQDFVAEARQLKQSPSVGARSIDTVFRHAHTSKGVLGQFGFPATYAALHDAEDGLARARTALAEANDEADRIRIAGEAIRDLDLDGLDQVFDADLDVVREALGEDYVAHGGATAISNEMTKALASLADGLLRRQPLDTDDAEVFDLLRRTSRLSKVSLKSVLQGYDRLVQQVAERFEKEVEPVTVSGADVWIDIDRYGPFLRTLVHVFRNAVAHGIETPDQREDAGKPAAGRIRCSVALEATTIRIVIEDDGRGIDRAMLRAELGGEAVSLTDDQICLKIFDDGVSTSGTQDDISGRGVGLPAVKAGAEALGGRVGVQSVPGRSTVFDFEVPVIAATGIDGKTE